MSKFRFCSVIISILTITTFCSSDANSVLKSTIIDDSRDEFYDCLTLTLDEILLKAKEEHKLVLLGATNYHLCLRPDEPSIVNFMLKDPDFFEFVMEHFVPMKIELPGHYGFLYPKDYLEYVRSIESRYGLDQNSIPAFLVLNQNGNAKGIFCGEDISSAQVLKEKLIEFLELN